MVKDGPELCPYGHKTTPFMTHKETSCSECLQDYEADTSMHKCLLCKKKEFGRHYCIGCTDTMNGTYKKLKGGIKLNKHHAGQSEGTYAVNHGRIGLNDAPYQFGNEKDVLNKCGGHVWRNESGLLMMRSPVTNTYPRFQNDEWVIVKWPCQLPQLASSHGVGSKRANVHLPPTSADQPWNSYEEGKYYARKAGKITIERHTILKRQCSGGMPGCILRLVKHE